MTYAEISLSPYARTMGVTVDRWEDGRPVLVLDFERRASGNPGTFHGGAIAGFLELAGMAALAAQLAAQGEAIALMPVNITIEYLRGTLARPLYGVGTVLKPGRRLSNLRVEAWQDDPAKPVAMAFLNAMPAPAGG